MPVGAGHLLRVGAQPHRILGLAIDEVDRNHPVGQPERGLDRVGDPLLGAGLDHHAVDHHVDVVLALLVEGRNVVELVHLAVDPHARITVGGELAEQFGVFALAAADHRGEDLEAGALVEPQQAVDDLLRCLAADRGAADRAVRVADARIEQAQVVVDLGDGAHRGPRIATGGLLVDGDGRRQPLDEVDVGFVHLSEELAGIGAQ